MLTLTATSSSDLLTSRPSETPPGVREAESAAATDLARNGTRAANEGFAKELAEVRARERSQGFGAQGRELETRDAEPLDAVEQPVNEPEGEVRSESAGHGEPATDDRTAPASPAHGGALRADLVEVTAKGAGASAETPKSQLVAGATGMAAGSKTLLTPAAAIPVGAGAPAPDASGIPLTAPATAHHAPHATAAPVTVAKTAAPGPVAQLAVEHRDSIFKQVAMTLEASGASSMELLLEPPDLGLLSLTLDLDGSQVRLTVGAERPEVAEQIKTHMLELRAALQAQGLEVTHFEVRDGAGDRSGSGAHAGGPRRRGGAAEVEIERRTEGVRLLEGSSLDILV